jgi:XTP/dITP diphosphohydrolase
VRRLEGRVVVATHNAGKLREIDALLKPFGIETASAASLGLPEPEETGASFAENAAIKARAAAQGARLPALADDSGLEVEALRGAPGVRTADWAETPRGRDYGLAMRKVQEALDAAEAPQPRRAAFVCHLRVAWPDGEEHGFEGRACGRLAWPPRGERGFGFDPMFLPDAGDGRLTFAEMAPETKHALSHRAAAFAQLKAALLEAP